MANQFDKFSKSMLGTTGLGMDEFETANTRPQKKKKASSSSKPSFEQAQAVKEAQNESRKGRGVKKGDRKLISFPVDNTTIERLDFLSYNLGKSKQDLYEEALSDLLTKYIEI